MSKFKKMRDEEVFRARERTRNALAIVESMCTSTTLDGALRAYDEAVERIGKRAPLHVPVVTHIALLLERKQKRPAWWGEFRTSLLRRPARAERARVRKEKEHMRLFNEVGERQLATAVQRAVEEQRRCDARLPSGTRVQARTKYQGWQPGVVTGNQTDGVWVRLDGFTADTLFPREAVRETVLTLAELLPSTGSPAQLFGYQRRVKATGSNSYTDEWRVRERDGTFARFGSARTGWAEIEHDVVIVWPDGNVWPSYTMRRTDREALARWELVREEATAPAPEKAREAVLTPLAELLPSTGAFVRILETLKSMARDLESTRRDLSVMAAIFDKNTRPKKPRKKKPRSR